MGLWGPGWSSTTFQSFWTGGAEGTFNSALPDTFLFLIARRHNVVNSIVHKDQPGVSGPSEGLCPLIGRFLIGPIACLTKRMFFGGGGVWRWVSGLGIDGEALFIHLPGSSKKSVSFPLVSPSLTRTPQMQIYVFCFVCFGRRGTHTDDVPPWHQLGGGLERLGTLRVRASQRGGCGYGRWQVQR